VNWTHQAPAWPKHPVEEGLEVGTPHLRAEQAVRPSWWQGATQSLVQVDTNLAEVEVAARRAETGAPSELTPAPAMKVQARVLPGGWQASVAAEASTARSAVIVAAGPLHPLVPKLWERRCAGRTWDRVQPHQQDEPAR